MLFFYRCDVSGVYECLFISDDDDNEDEAIQDEAEEE